MEKGPRIIFMGTPEFAVASLGALLMNEFNVVAVVTSPDKPAGRGRKISRSAVAKYAEDNYLTLLQPENLKDESFIKTLKDLKPDIAVVVAFRMLPEVVWRLPCIGTFNLHASLLPQYRGAAPINHAIINGESKTGVTTFLIDDKIDTGNILYRRSLKISQNENAGELHDRLMRSGAKLVVKTVNKLYSGKIKPKTQEKYIAEGESLRSAPKIFSKDCFIDWDTDAADIHNFVRGLSPYPGARTIFSIDQKKVMVKILEGKALDEDSGTEPGTLIISAGNRLSISTSNGLYEPALIQPEGKKTMRIEEYLRGISPDSTISLFKDPQA